MMLLYMHIPFCDSKCNYCAFNSYVSMHHVRKEYMKCLVKQLRYELKNKSVDKFSSIFIGGGTPSCIDANEYTEIFELLEDYIDINTEITTEANPNSATQIWQKEMYDLGVNRISFGVQSFNNKKLEFLSRNHNKNQAIQAINNANNVGFKNINCDIIYDTILDTKTLIDNDLKIIENLKINHISAYSLTLEKGTVFYNKENVKKENVKMTRYIFEKLNNFGFYQYEISNFSTQYSTRCKHNLGYWKYENYIGIGSGAIGHMNKSRLYVTKNIENYLQNPIKYSKTELLNYDDVITEKTLLGLRSVVGCDLSWYNDKQLEKINYLIAKNKIFLKNKTVFVFDYLLADEIALYILQ